MSRRVAPRGGPRPMGGYVAVALVAGGWGGSGWTGLGRLAAAGAWAGWSCLGPACKGPPPPRGVAPGERRRRRGPHSDVRRGGAGRGRGPGRGARGAAPPARPPARLQWLAGPAWEAGERGALTQGAPLPGSASAAVLCVACAHVGLSVQGRGAFLALPVWDGIPFACAILSHRIAAEPPAAAAQRRMKPRCWPPRCDGDTLRWPLVQQQV